MLHSIEPLASSRPAYAALRLLAISMSIRDLSPDDVFVDAKRHRVYVSCGDGHLDIFVLDGGSFRRVAHIPTAPGARTSLFVPKLDRLFLAVRAGHGENAAIWVYQPTP